MDIQNNEREVSFRPKYFAEEVTHATVSEVLASVLKYLDNQSDDIDQIKNDLFNAFEFDDSSYQICKNLERNSWLIDDELVELFKNVAHIRYTCWKKCICEWVKINKPIQKYNKENIVQFVFEGSVVIGIIVNVDESEATYLIFSAQLGHVKTNGKTGVYVPFEKVL